MVVFVGEWDATDEVYLAKLRCNGYNVMDEGKVYPF